MTQDGWQARLTKHVASQVRRYRLDRRLSAQRLADRCAELGMEIPRAVLSNLENGRRESVTLAEVCILAAALEVPPLELVLPIGREARMDMLPGWEISPWAAAQWFCGEVELESGRDGLVLARELPRPDDLPVHHMALHQHLVDSVMSLRGHVRRRIPDLSWAATSLTKEEQAAYRSAGRLIEQELTTLRNRMREQGLIPPDLPEPLADVDAAAPGAAHE